MLKTFASFASLTVLVDMKQLYAVTLLLVLRTFSIAQLQSSVERPCPGENVVFTCTISSVGHQWEIPSLNISLALLPRSEGRVITDHPPFQFTVTKVISGKSITSTATVTARIDLNGTLVVCLDGIGMVLKQDSTITLSGFPSVPTLSCVGLSGDVSGAVNVTVSWTLSDGDSADFYLIRITTNSPQAPYGGVLNITTSSNITQQELTGFLADYEYNITIHGVNCKSMKGSECEPLMITPQVFAAPSSCNITLSYNQTSKGLLFINSIWDTVPNPGDPCQGVSGKISLYQISFRSAFSVATESVNATRCTAGRCSHTFEPPSNPPLSYDSVSVAAENVVGVGAARKCTTQTISSRNHLLAGKVVGLSSPIDARVNCRFLRWFTGSAHCTVQYGTDPTYMNLPYSAESTETGTARDTVSVVLRERLNSSTVYYYNVSAVSGDVTVTVRGNFRTPQYNCSVRELWNLQASDAIYLTDVSLVNDTVVQYPSCDDESVGSAVLKNTTLNIATAVYYTGTTPGSRACFVCSDGYELNTTTNERFCEGNGLWSGNYIVCECRLSPKTIALIMMGTLAIVATLVGAIVTTIDGTNVCYINFRKQNQRIRECWKNIVEDIKDDWRNRCWLAVVIIAGIFCVIGIVLWIMVGVLNPPNGNACDPSWSSTRYGLISAAFVSSMVAYSFAAAAIWVHVCYHIKEIKENKKGLMYALLVIAFLLTVVGVGLVIALTVLVQSRRLRKKRQKTKQSDTACLASENTKELVEEIHRVEKKEK